MKFRQLKADDTKQIGMVLGTIAITLLVVVLVLTNDALVNPKLLVAIAAGLILIAIIAEGRYSFIYWFAIFAVFCRRLNVPFVGEWEPATLIFFLLFFLMASKALPSLLTEWIGPMLIFAFVFIIGKLNGPPTDKLALEWVMPFLTLYGFLSVSKFFLQTEKDLERLSSFIIIISGIIGFTALLAYIGLADGTVILTSRLEGEGSKIYGISYTNNVHGYTPIALLFLKDKKWKWWLRIGILISIVFGVLISEKRLAFISLLIVSIEIARQSYVQKDYKMLMVIIAGALVVVAYFLDRFVARFSLITTTLETNKATTDTTRLYRITWAWEQYLKSPFFGHGAGYVYYTHNGFLEMLGNMGLMALPFFYRWLIIPLKYFFSKGLQQKWAVAVVVYMVSLFAFEIGINRLELFWVFILVYTGFIYAVKIQNECNKQASIKQMLHEIG